jgi:hypothetical protein
MMNNVKRLPFCAALLALCVLWLSGCNVIKEMLGSDISTEGGEEGTETSGGDGKILDPPENKGEEDTGAPDSNIYVSNSTGNDEVNTGARESPFLTVTTALAKVQELNASNLWYDTSKIVILDTVPVAETISIGGGYPSLVLSGAGTLQFTGASGYLLALSETAQVTLDGALTLQGNSSGGGVTMAGSSAFTMNGGKITGNTRTNENGGGVYVDGTSHFTMSIGEITGNKAPNGGGVYVNGASAAFEMNGGIISLNTATEYYGVDKGGGGVYVNGGAFTMTTGAEITNNTAANNGGGIYVNGTSAFMKGGIISLNRSQISTSGGGGGVYVNDGSFTVETGAEISKNTAVSHGGGVHVNKGTFTMEPNTEISGNEATYSGGGVYLGYGTIAFNMNGGKISGNHANGTSSSGGGVYDGASNGCTFTMKTGAEISNNTAATDGGGVYINYTTFYMQGGTISYNRATNSGGGVKIDFYNPLYMSDGEISYNEALNGGGVSTGVTFEMSGGTIHHNKATGTKETGYGYGGGVYGNLKLSGTGEISENTAVYGGGVSTLSGNYGSILISGGIISGNEATSDGGGIYAAYEIAFTMVSGTISNNNASGKGGGICFNYAPVSPFSDYSALFIEGTISENTAPNGNAISYLEGTSITMPESIGVNSTDIHSYSY